MGFRAKKHADKHLFFILLFSFLLLIAFAVCIPQLSFYGDDWIYIYNGHIAGAESFKEFTAWDRPFSAWVYILAFSLFGENPLGWHIGLWILRWLSTFLFWKILLRIFGEQKMVYGAVLLFAVYPGFQQQPIAVEFMMHFTTLVLLLASILLMQQTVESQLSPVKSIILRVLSMILAAAAIFTCEYFIGLELARPIILFLTLFASGTLSHSSRLKKTLIHTIPYAFVTAFYFIWRIFIFSFQTYQPKLLTAMKENPVTGLRTLFTKIIQDLYTVLVRAYRSALSRPSMLSTGLAAAVFLLTMVLVAAAFKLLFKGTVTADNRAESMKEKQMIFLGSSILLFSGIPYWGTFLDVTVSFPWDRSTLSFCPGAVLLIAALLSAAFKENFCILLTAALTAVSVIFQLNNEKIYAYEAEKMRDYFWQLSWRMPALEKGTILISDDIPLNRYSDNDLSPIVNWQFNPEKLGLLYDYKYFDLDLREETWYADPSVTLPVEHTYRSHFFSSTTEKSLGIYYKENGCLQIIDPENTNYPGTPDSLKHTAEISNPDLILPDTEKPALPPAAIGEEPENSYCRYFQKISLEQQRGNSEESLNLAQEVLNLGLTPNYSADWSPVLWALLSAEDYDSAGKIMAEISADEEGRKYLCSWLRQKAENTPNEAEINRFLSERNCF